MNIPASVDLLRLRGTRLIVQKKLPRPHRGYEDAGIPSALDTRNNHRSAESFDFNTKGMPHHLP